MNNQCLTVFLIVLCLTIPVHGAKFLWDASRECMAGNADWVIDADGTYGHQGDSDPQRFPSPDQSNITGSTHESYWYGANSEWAIRLVKSGHYVETLPLGSQVTYESPSNPQDLSNYDVYILNEPQDPFSTAEIQAIYNFIEDGGGVLMVGDHCGSDRNHNGWDSPEVFNAMNLQSELGVWFKNDENCEFTQNVENVSTDPFDPIINGPFGGVEMIECHGAIELELYPDINPTVCGHAWRNPYPQAESHVIVATCEYGMGRVGFVNDSSITDDGTGDPNDNLHDNFSVSANDDDHLMLNLSVWLSGSGPSNPTPTPTGPTPTPTGPTPTPSPTNTPASGIHSGVEIQLNSNRFFAGDTFQLDVICGNPDDSQLADLYVVLDVYGEYWFFPGWAQTLDFRTISLPNYDNYRETVLKFTWPDVDSHADGLMFWGAMLNMTGQILGKYDWIEWGYE